MLKAKICYFMKQVPKLMIMLIKHLYIQQKILQKKKSKIQQMIRKKIKYLIKLKSQMIIKLRTKIIVVDFKKLKCV